MSFKSKIRTIQWVDNVSRMVDQTRIPYEYVNVDIKTGKTIFELPDFGGSRGGASGIVDNEVVDSFVGNIEKEEIKSFLTKNLNIK